MDYRPEPFRLTCGSEQELRGGCLQLQEFSANLQRNHPEGEHKKMNSKFLMAACAAVFGLGILTGCSQEAKENLDAAGDNMAKAADKTGEDMAAGAAKAGEATGDAAVTAKVKSALMSAEGIDSEHINVDTVGKTVMLKGMVDTEAAKTKAEQIAKDQAGSDYTVENQLTVGATHPADPTKNNG
jgi:predicted lysophospholipase L1 biosynthesis ABC-type transport system permease subunit